jgi:hypothetical protein
MIKLTVNAVEIGCQILEILLQFVSMRAIPHIYFKVAKEWKYNKY